jgi:hypothetical protein
MQAKAAQFQKIARSCRNADAHFGFRIALAFKSPNLSLQLLQARARRAPGGARVVPSRLLEELLVDLSTPIEN